MKPLVVDDGKHSGNVTLTVDLDSTGTISEITRTAGDATLVPLAEKLAKVFRDSQLANMKNVSEQVIFLHGPAIKKVQPVYPPIAKSTNVRGTVMVGVAVEPDGHVAKALALAGPLMLQSSAVDAVRQWIFPPRERNGSPISFRAIIFVNYELF